jgi:hypothetical protein
MTPSTMLYVCLVLCAVAKTTAQKSDGAHLRGADRHPADRGLWLGGRESDSELTFPKDRQPADNGPEINSGKDGR